MQPQSPAQFDCSNPFLECFSETSQQAARSHSLFSRHNDNSASGKAVDACQDVPNFPQAPVVIEVFAGSARVTAALKAEGLFESFGVDVDTSKAVATSRCVDLTAATGQKLLLRWIQSPLVKGLFIAPPCGTCSMARFIQLRDSKGRRIPCPPPLRSAVFPEGLPNLRPIDRLRVSSANKLYAFVQKLIQQAQRNKIVIVLENPRSSLFWATRFWRQRQVPVEYAAHQACAFGSSRPKWTVLAFTHPAFRQINQTCPGTSAFHKHKQTMGFDSGCFRSSPLCNQ